MVLVLSDQAAPAQPQTASWSDLPVEEVYPGITRQVVNGDRQTMVRYSYQPGSVFPAHAHPQEQVTVVISGDIEFTVAGQQYRLHAGDVAVIPGGVEHGARVTGSQVVETFNALSPKRDRSPGPAEKEPSRG
jgi:quercetin dioxygenase-like cupin family protein